MQVIRKCIENGIISDWFLFCPTAMRIAPPLNINMAGLEKALEKLKNVLNSF